MKMKSLLLGLLGLTLLGMPLLAADSPAPLTDAQFADLMAGLPIDLPTAPESIDLASSACLTQPCPWVQCGACIQGCWTEYLEVYCYCIAEEPGNQACVAEANRQRKACILSCMI